MAQRVAAVLHVRARAYLAGPPPLSGRVMPVRRVRQHVMVTRPWYPGVVVANDRSLLTDPLATWHPEYALELTQWKSRRYYVDARDVDESSWADHPGHAVPASKKKLRELMGLAPVFALGDRPGAAKALREHGARTYEVSFSRTGGEGLVVIADGPEGRRGFSGSIHELPFDPQRYDAVNRILRAISDGRLSERSMDLAELFGALSGDDTYLVFTGAERDEYMDVLERALRQVFARARKSPERGRAIMAALDEADARGANTLTDVADLGPAELHVMEERRVSSTQVEGRPLDGVLVEGLDDHTLRLPEQRTWILYQPLKPWLPPAEKEWRAGAGERHRAHWAVAERQRADQKARLRARQRPALIVLVVLVLAGIGWWVNQMRKGPFLEPCRADGECRSGLCRVPEGSPGYCTRRCRDGCTQGTRCGDDARLGQSVCVRE